MLDNFIYFRKKISQPSISGREITGEILIELNDVTKLNILTDNDIMDDYVFVNQTSRKVNELKENDLVKISLYANKLKDGYYFEVVDDLIQRFPTSIPDKRFYVFSEQFDSQVSDHVGKIKDYYQVVELINLLKEMSDHSFEEEIFFFKSKLLKLPINYKINDLIDSNKIKNLIIVLNSSSNKEERRIIFINELSNSLLNIEDKSERFKYFLTHFDDIIDNYSKSFNLYLENFSYNKLKSEINNQILDYTKKIYSVINDAQTKLLTIPIAFLLIISQFDFEGNKLYFNLALVLGSITYSFFLEILIRNQFSILNYISKEIVKYKSELEKKQTSILKNEINVIFSELPVINNKQLNYLKIFRVIIWGIPLTAVIIFIFVTFKNCIDIIFQIFIKILKNII